MRGRKPVPTSLKLLHNNPGRRPINDHEPQHAAVDTACPLDIAGDLVAAAEWARLIGTLTQNGHVTTVDRATLVGYCLKYAQWLALETEARKHPFIVRAPSGYPIPNPALGMANKAFALVLKSAAELGITPSSRSRINVPRADPAPDAFTAWQQRRRATP